MSMFSEQQRAAFAAKYRDPRWQKKRLEVMQRDDFRCRNCKTTEVTLNVHHRYYTTGANPWEYTLDALVTLCEDCHATETANIKVASHALLQALKRFGCTAEDMSDLAFAVEHAEIRGEQGALALFWAIADVESQRFALKRWDESVARSRSEAEARAKE